MYLLTKKQSDNYWCAYYVNDAMLDDLDNKLCIHAIQISINMTKLSWFFEPFEIGYTPPIYVVCLNTFCIPPISQESVARKVDTF